MNDDRWTHPDLNVSPIKLWTPSPALRGRLLLGTVASLTYGGLVAAAATTAREPEQPIAPVLFLLWASAIPAAGTLWAYLGVAREVESFQLRKSSWCAFGVVFLWQLAVLAVTDLLPSWGDTLVLCAVAAGSVGLLFIAFYLPTGPTSGGTGTTTSPKGSKAGWGGAGLALLFLVKFGANFLLHLGFRQAMWEVIAVLFLLACTIGFVVRFALSKIQLRSKLGGMAAFVGVAEIAALIGAGIVLVGAILAIQEASQVGRQNEKQLEDLQQHWTNVSLMFAAAVSLTWASLTALLHVILWHRHDPDADWSRDWRDAENAR